MPRIAAKVLHPLESRKQISGQILPRRELLTYLLHVAQRSKAGNQADLSLHVRWHVPCYSWGVTLTETVAHANQFIRRINSPSPRAQHFTGQGCTNGARGPPGSARSILRPSRLYDRARSTTPAGKTVDSLGLVGSRPRVLKSNSSAMAARSVINRDQFDSTGEMRSLMRRIPGIRARYGGAQETSVASFTQFAHDSHWRQRYLNAEPAVEQAGCVRANRFHQPSTASLAS